MKSIYCPIEARDCSPIDCEDVSEYFLGVDCACLSPNELELLKDKIENNADAIAQFRIDQYKQIEQLYADLAPRFSALQELINDNTLRIADTNTRIDIIGLALGNAIKDLANLEQYSKDFLKDVIDRHTTHINDLHRNVSENAGDIYNLQLQDDSLEELLNKIKNISLDNKETIQKILATLFAQGIFIEGVTDTEELPDFGDSSAGPCSDCANKGDTNHFLGDNYFYAVLELINRDFVIRHPFPKGTKPRKESHLDVIWRDDAGNVTSDNISSVASMVEPNGDVKTALRAYRNVSGSIEHCDIILTTPQTGESYVELSNLKIGTQYNEYQCGTGWLETWDWIHGHTTLEIDKSVKLNTKDGDTHIYGDTNMYDDVHMNIEGGTTIIEGDTHIHNTFEVDGDSHFHNNVHIDENTYVEGWIKAEGTIEGNTNTIIKGPGDTLLNAKGYDCSGGGPHNIIRVQNGKEVAVKWFATAGNNTTMCHTMDVYGGLMTRKLNENMHTTFMCEGCATVLETLCVGNPDKKLPLTSPLAGHIAADGGISCSDGMIVIGRTDKSGREHTSFATNYFTVSTKMHHPDLPAQDDEHYQAGSYFTGGLVADKFHAWLSLSCHGVVQFGSTESDAIVAVNGSLTINGVEYSPCSCGSEAAAIMNLLCDNTQDNHYTLINNIGDSNTVNGICKPVINNKEVYEVEVTLPVFFKPGTWSVQATYTVENFVKSMTKELVPLIVEIAPGATNKFKVHGNLLGFTWSATGNTD